MGRKIYVKDKVKKVWLFLFKVKNKLNNKNDTELKINN